MPNKLKHLEMIQSVISRMANNSFLIKGWCITLVSALFVLSQKDANENYVLIAFIPILLFWILDGYFLSTERAYRGLYDVVRRIQDDTQINFSMDKSPYQSGRGSWLNSTFSITLIIYYATLVVAILVAMVIVG